MVIIHQSKKIFRTSLHLFFLTLFIFDSNFVVWSWVRNRWKISLYQTQVESIHKLFYKHYAISHVMWNKAHPSTKHEISLTQIFLNKMFVSRRNKVEDKFVCFCYISSFFFYFFIAPLMRSYSMHQKQSTDDHTMYTRDAALRIIIMVYYFKP